MLFVGQVVASSSSSDDDDGDAVKIFQQIEIAELFSPPRVTHLARAHFPCFKKEGLKAMDLESGQDFRSHLGRAEAERVLQEGCAKVVILSPPCTMFSKLMHCFNLRQMDHQKREDRWAEAHTYLDWSMSLCQKQAQGGKYFIFEHPASATSWERQSVKDVADLDGTHIVTFDMCRFGMMSPDGSMPLQKPTKVMTNMPTVLQRLSNSRCICTVPHRPIRGTQAGVAVSKHAQVYPFKFCAVLLMGIQEMIAPDEPILELPSTRNGCVW